MAAGTDGVRVSIHLACQMMVAGRLPPLAARQSICWSTAG
jgi:hypothetical protein